MTLERVVRPFQLRDVTPPRRSLTAYEVAAAPVALVLGKTGSGKAMHGSQSTTVTLYMDTKLKEPKS